jgi:hypothetical protein
VQLGSVTSEDDYYEWTFFSDGGTVSLSADPEGIQITGPPQIETKDVTEMPITTGTGVTSAMPITMYSHTGSPNNCAVSHIFFSSGPTDTIVDVLTIDITMQAPLLDTADSCTFAASSDRGSTWHNVLNITKWDEGSSKSDSIDIDGGMSLLDGVKLRMTATGFSPSSCILESVTVNGYTYPT